MNRFSILIIFCILISSGPTKALDTIAKQAIIFDVESKTIIFEKNADELMSPSSMSKLLTVYYVFKQLKLGNISLKDTFPVSKKAWKKGGSRMFLNLGSDVSIEDLLRGIIVQSGNDACITIAEGFSGSEENFAVELNNLARDLGLTNSSITNSTGWPDPDHLTTSRDLLTLSLRTIQDFPEYYKLYAEREFTYNKIRQINRNPLLFSDSFSDGLKTGHTSLGGYGLAASSIRNNRRIILVINGLNTNSARRKESKRLMDAAFLQFKNVLVYSNEKNDYLNVWNGKKTNLKIKSNDNLIITVPNTIIKDLKFFLRHKYPLTAPILEGTEIAEILVKKNNTVLKKFPLYAAENVDSMNFFKKIIFKFKYLIFGESIFR
tara:strand:+ start:846 stop:1976 length:1131 start_codon:yes stop_codon:yes gene_type:complete